MIKGVILDWIGVLYQRNVGLVPYTESVLSELTRRGYKLGQVCIAKPPLSIREKREEIERTGIQTYFSSIIIDAQKNETHYLKCIEEMELTPECTLIVDDRVDRGIMIGNRIGSSTAWIQTGEYTHMQPDEKTGNPTYRINTIEDLLEILPDLN